MKNWSDLLIDSKSPMRNQMDSVYRMGGYYALTNEFKADAAEAVTADSLSQDIIYAIKPRNINLHL